MIMGNVQTKKVHYGWVITAACAIIMFYSIGLAVNCFAVFLTPLIKEVGLTKAQGSMIQVWQQMAGMLTMLLCGPLFKRFGISKVTYMAGICSTLGFLLFLIAKNQWGCYLASFMVGIGYGAGSMMPISLLMSNWFEKKRGFALGIASAGSGIGTILYPPILASIIIKYGVKAGLACVSISILCLATLAMLLIYNKPEDKALLPFGSEGILQIEKVKKEPKGLTLKVAWKTREFRLMILGLALLGANMQPVLNHLSTFYTSEGRTAVFAASMISLYGVVMISSKPAYGWIIDRFGLVKAHTVIFGCWMISMVTGLFIGRSSTADYMFTIFFGMGVPLGSISFSIWAEALFGPKDLANIYAIFKSAFSLGALIGAVILGFIAETTGQYINVFPVYIGTTILAYTVLQYVFIMNRKKSIYSA